MFNAKRLLLVFLLVFTFVLSFAGAKFKGFNRPEQQAVLNVPSSPEVVVPFHILALAVETPTGTFPYGLQLRASIDKELTGAFSVVQTGGEGVLTVSVLEFAPPMARSYMVKEYRAVVPNNSQTAQAQTTTKKSWTSKLDVLNSSSGQVPVQYWEAQGQLTLKAVLKDKTGASIDETILKAPFSMKRETAVNNIPTVDPQALPQQDAIMTFLLREGARKVRRRYAIGLEPTLVKLPIDNELLVGNRMAMEDNWDGALKAWQTAAAGSNPADQKFSMALANYALTFKTFAEQDADAAATQYEAAAHLLAEARTIDPKESYFVEIDSRMAAAKAEIDKAAQQAKALAMGRDRKALREAEARGNTAGASGSKSLTSDQPDTPQQGEFRSYIRAQWKNRTQPPTDADFPQLVDTGRLGWKLTPDQARQVVQSEANSWSDRKSKMDIYLSQLKSFIQNGILSAEGRGQLRKLSANLGLTNAETAAIESKVAFREPARTRAGGTKP